MTAKQNDHHLYHTYPFESKVKIDQDSISCDHLNIDTSPSLHYLSPQLSHRRISTKRLTNTVNVQHDSSGLRINGSLFDRQLFQPSCPSYILDYSHTPKDLNRYLEAQKTISKSSYLDSHLFKLSFVITLSDWHVDKELLLICCPHEDDNTHIIEEITFYKRFCFPELNVKEANGGKLIDELATYIFTRTTSKGHLEYGYCRRIDNDDNQITNFPIVICIVSTYPYFKLYDAILDELIAAYLSSELECSQLMQAFYAKPLPTATLNSPNIVCKLGNNRVFSYSCPHDDRLQHDYFSTLLSSLSPAHVLQLFESMLRSKKILCFSHSLSKLTKCCLALSFLIYPLMWPYPFVSIMPSSWMQDLIDSPCPYIYGCLYDTFQQLSPTIEKEFLRVNLDLNTIDGGLDDGFVLPLDLRQTLQASLEYATRFRLAKSNLTLNNVAVSEACLRIFTELFHRLPDYFKRDQSSLESKDKEQKFAICSDYFKHDDSGIDLQSIVSNESSQQSKKKEENRLGYDFRSDEFLISQPTSAYVNFLNDFIHGMIFLKFLDDYQRVDGNSRQSFFLFSQRLNERRRMTMDELSINPLIRFRQMFDLLEKQINQSSKTTNPFLSKLVKKLFE